MSGIGCKIVYLHYCRLISDAEKYCVHFDGIDYEIIFKNNDLPEFKSYIIKRRDGQSIQTNFLIWLSVYIGEDAVEPFPELDTRFVSLRGNFKINEKSLQRFLNAALRAERRKWPKWKQELFNDAIVYFSAAARAGINMMPLNIGLFALSLECLGNVKCGRQNKHWNFGDRKFINILIAKLARSKRNDTEKVEIRRFEKMLHADIHIVNALRNAFYGHSLLHMKEDKEKLVRDLREWMVRDGYSRKFANISFRKSRVRDDVVRESFALYKLGLRINRLFLFMVLGFSRSIPFASHDWTMLGDNSDGEIREFRGVKMTFQSSN